MIRLWRWLHALLLVPVLIVLVVVTSLRAGVQSHPQYHEQVEAWLSEALQQTVNVADFELKLHGSQLQLQVYDAHLSKPELFLSRLNLQLDMLHLLQTGQLELSNMQLHGIELQLLQHADGSWQPKGVLAQPAQVQSDASQASVDNANVALALLAQAG